MMYRFLFLLSLPLLTSAQPTDLQVSILEKGLLINNYYLQQNNDAPQLLRDVLGEPDRIRQLENYGRILVYDEAGLSFRISNKDELLQAEICFVPLRGEWKPASPFSGKLSLRGVPVDRALSPRRLWKLFPKKVIYSSKDWSHVAFAHGDLKIEALYPFEQFVDEAEGWSGLTNVRLTWLEQQPPLQDFYFKGREMMMGTELAVKQDYLSFEDLTFYGNSNDMAEMADLSELAQSFEEDASQGRILFRQFRKMNPAGLSVEALLQDAKQLLDVDAYEAAVALLERAVKEHKKVYDLHLQLGMAYWYRGLDAAAVEALEEALALNPEETTDQKAAYFRSQRLIEEIKAE